MTGDPTTYSVTFELTRDQMLTANDRKNWRAASRPRAALRLIGATPITGTHDDGTPRWLPYMDRAHLTVYVSWPDRRRRDVANLHPTIKALIDGIVTDANRLPDDDDAHLIGPDLRVTRHLSGIAGVTVLRFDFVPLEVAA